MADDGRFIEIHGTVRIPYRVYGAAVLVRCAICRRWWALLEYNSGDLRTRPRCLTCRRRIEAKARPATVSQRYGGRP